MSIKAQAKKFMSSKLTFFTGVITGNVQDLYGLIIIKHTSKILFDMWTEYIGLVVNEHNAVPCNIYMPCKAILLISTEVIVTMQVTVNDNTLAGFKCL